MRVNKTFPSFFRWGFCRESWTDFKAAFFQKNVHADDLLMVLLDNLGDIVKLTTESPDLNRFELLRCLVDFSSRGQNSETNTQVSKLSFSGEEGLKTISNVFQICFDQLQPVTEDVTPEVLNAFSEDFAKLKELECFLLATYNVSASVTPNCH